MGRSIGSYEIVKLIGEGTFGRTFLGKHIIFPDVKACLKEAKIFEDATQNKMYENLFREEAEVIAKLQHPSLVVFRDYLEVPSSHGLTQILILNYVEGTPLDDLVGEFGPVNDMHLCWILDRVLGALSYLQGRWQIIHCDIKPGNIILNVPEHEATLVDLGLAAINPVEWSKAKGGTPGYLPPEFGMGLPPIPASDIFSLGKVALMLTGGDPLKSTFPEDMDPRLRDFLDPWIRHDPRERPDNPDKLRYDLAQLRVQIFGQSTCTEMFKFRNGKEWTP